MPGLGDCVVSEIRPFQVEAFKDALAPLVAAGGYSPITVNGWLKVLKVISKAVAREYETRDFMLGVENFDTSTHATYTEEAPNSLPPVRVPEFLGLLRRRNSGFRAGSALQKPFKDVVECMGLSYALTPRAMRRTFQDLARAAQVADIVTRSVSGHATAEMQRWYSTVHPEEQRASLSRVLRVIEGGLSQQQVVSELVSAEAEVVSNQRERA